MLISSGKLIEIVAPALGLEPDEVHKIVLEIECCEGPVTAYVVLKADKRTLDIEWDQYLTDVRVVKKDA